MRILRELKVPLIIHQPSYSLLNRWVEEGLLQVLEQEGVGCIAFSPLAQGLLTTKYLNGVPDSSRAMRNESFRQSMLTDQNLVNVRALNDVAKQRGQSLAQMAIAWVLKNPSSPARWWAPAAGHRSKSPSARCATLRLREQSSTRLTRTRATADSISGPLPVNPAEGSQSRRGN